MLRCFNCVWFFAEPVNSNPPGSFVHGVLQAWILEWFCHFLLQESSRPRDRTCLTFLSCICRQVLYHLAPQCSNLETDFSTFSICYITIWRSEAENGFPWAKTRVTAWLLSFWGLKRRICLLSLSSFSICPIVSDLWSSSILKASSS